MNPEFNAENNVLGYLLTNDRYYWENYQELKSDLFLEPLNREIFDKFKETIRSNSPTLYVLSQFFSFDYLSSLTNNLVYTVSFQESLTELKKRFTSYKLSLLGIQLSVGPVDERVELLKTSLEEIITTQSFKTTTISEAVDDFIKTVKSRRDSGGLSGIGTGLTDYDRFTGGFQPSDLVIIAGETSQGKTSLALTMIRHAAVRFGARVCVFSYEMTQMQIVSRMMAQVSGINSKRLMSANVSDEELENTGFHPLKESNILIDACSTTSIDYLLNNLRMYKIRYGVNIAVIDYLQLLRFDKKGISREQEVGMNTRLLKNIAKELDITVVVLSQLSRDRGTPKPTLNRLRDSGQIEEAADQVIFVYRPEMYGIEHFEDSDIPTEGVAFVMLAKGRNVGVCSFYLNFDKYTTNFTNYQTSDFTQETRDFTAPF